ncbi:hypothetical protein AAF712_015142 [Marasmius tenuissimus]|uniref:CxC2-like cysteine cluster KDZ transposase-associated domain-containing protein n=1 Tax=Marasmius tenuissimus TaxID=585030 RepID=A0ABR2ZAE4_9AGAR
MKRRRNGTSALSNRVEFIVTREDDEPILEQKKAHSYEEEWNEARAQLQRTFDMLTRRRPRLFGRSGDGTLFSDIPIYDSSAPDDDKWNDEDFQPAVGEEGFINSNAGGEFNYHTFLSSLLAEAPARVDLRDRHHWTEDQTQSWNRQLPRLVNAYMKYQASGIPSEDELEGQEWKIRYMDFEVLEYARSAIPTLPMRPLLGLVCLAVALTNQMLLSPSNFLKLFAKYIESAHDSASTVYHVYLPTYMRFPTPTLEDQLRVAYDAYLAIQREVQSRVDCDLGRDPHQHFIRHVCPPCMYQLNNEAPLKPAILLAMDGNNSLKMVDSEKCRIDTRRLEHPRWLDATTVDVFKDEVANSHKRSQATKPKPDDSDHQSTCDGPEFDQDEVVAWLDVNEIEGLETCVDTCVECWKAAGPDANKKMYSFFAISGIFISVCRHGHVLVLCDMHWSGELMKYPLVVVQALLEQYRKDIGLGYDIMCAFLKTLLRSPQLREKVIACRLRGVVPSFHGHAHNRKCQVSWHPMYIDGVGLEDFEECERTFSESNHLAATTRLATEFHCHQSLMEHFDFHDVDKHMTSGNFIYQNYCQAVERITTDSPLFLELCEQYGISEDDRERFLREETEHFTREYTESPEVTARLNYVELLQKLTKHR